MTKRGGEPAADAPAGIDWEAITRRLVLYAMHDHHLPLADAEQIAQEAIYRYFGGDAERYDAERHGTVLRFLRGIVNGLVSNVRRHEAHGRAWTVESATWIESAPTPEEHAILIEHGRQALARLRRRTKRDPIVWRLVEAIVLEGVCGPTAQAEHLGVRVEDIYEAWRRLKEHLQAISISMGVN